MKTIDFHTHFFPNKLFGALWRWFETHAWSIKYKLPADELISVLKKEGVDRCVSLHYPHKKDMAGSLNEWTHHFAEKYSDFVIPFGSLHPDDENQEGILKKCFDDYGFRGLKLHCHVQKMAPDDERLDTLYQICNDQEKIVLIHCGTGPHFKEQPTDGYGYDVTAISGVRRFEKVIKRYPKIKFVVPHLGYEEVEAFIHLLDDYPNLHLDTAMAVADYFPIELNPDWLIQHADRILFGSDFPHLPYPWKTEKDRLLSFNLGTDVEEKILWKNAEKLLSL